MIAHERYRALMPQAALVMWGQRQPMICQKACQHG